MSIQIRTSCVFIAGMPDLTAFSKACVPHIRVRTCRILSSQWTRKRHEESPVRS